MAGDSDPAPAGLRLRSVSLARGGRPVLRGASLTAPRDQVTIVVAPSGAGKSTLLRCCNGLLAPDAGTVLLDGVEIGSLPATAVRRRVGLVGQTPTMLPGTVADNLSYGLLDRDDGSDAALAAALAAAGLDASFLPRPAQELSGGERARVALARALTRGPELLLLDEPTAALDAVVAAHIAETVRRLAHEERLGVLVVTHDLAFAAAVADRAVALRDGRVVEGELAAVLREAGGAEAGGAGRGGAEAAGAEAGGAEAGGAEAGRAGADGAEAGAP
jgi:ABC-type cobalamin/Fe3+-siderophores transport system ATPase subunit